MLQDAMGNWNAADIDLSERIRNINGGFQFSKSLKHIYFHKVEVVLMGGCAV
jgi:hypothetical protein